MTSVCVNPCNTCIGDSLFYKCLTCKSSQIALNGSLCLKQPIFIIQIICTFLLLIFIISPLIRKRSVTLIRIFDAIQMVAYYKYINGYIQNRQNYLYLGMRAWSQWSQGWKLLSFQNDVTFPIWTNEETMVNKVLRIVIVWAGVIIIMIFLGIVKTMMGDSQVTLTNYIFKNLPLAGSIGFYINIQDMSLIMANAFHLFISTGSFSNIYIIIQLVAAIGFLITIGFITTWMFFIINFDYIKKLQKTPQKIYPHVNMFLLALDYDIFPTYELTTLPKNQKKIYRYSNIRIIDIYKKIFYSFLIVSYLYGQSDTLKGEIYGILGFIIFFDIIWYLSMPYDLQNQKIQFVLSVLADILKIVILVIPLIISNSTIQMILCLSLFGLAITSFCLELFLDVYSIIPVDLYETGLSIIIQDKKLLKQIQQRKRLQQEYDLKLRQMQQNNKRLQQQLQMQKMLKQSSRKQIRQNNQQSQKSLRHDLQKKDFNNTDQKLNNKLFINPNQNDNQLQEHTSMNSDDAAQLYKIDQSKRRKIYQFNKKAKFIYSNKLDD